MLLVGQEIALTFDFCSTATLTLAKGEFLGFPLQQKTKLSIKKTEA